MLAVLRRLEARVYGGDTADGLAVRGVRAYGGVAGVDSAQPRAGRRDGARVGSGGAPLGAGAASGGAGADAGAGGARPATAAHGRARRRDATRSAQTLLLVPCSSRFFSKNLNTTGPSDEYQRCRSRYQQHFLQRLYRVFLPRFENI
jgi:hypothetical protein